MQKIETGISELLKRQPVTEQEKDAYIQDLQKALRASSGRSQRFGRDGCSAAEEAVWQFQRGDAGAGGRRAPGRIPGSRAEYKDRCPGNHSKRPERRPQDKRSGPLETDSSNETENRIFDPGRRERICPRCKGKLVWIGKELVREVFEYQRPKLKLVRYWQMSYKCPACHKKGRSVIVRASVPKPLLNHSLVAASVVAEIMYQKYVNAMAAVPAGSSMETAGVGDIQPDHHGALESSGARKDWLEPLWDAMRKELLQRGSSACR